MESGRRNAHERRGRSAGPAGLAAAALVAAVLAAAVLPGDAAPLGGGVVTVRVATLSPLVALIAGILILLVPRILNFVVAIYLIIVGVIGLFGR